MRLLSVCCQLVLVFPVHISMPFHDCLFSYSSASRQDNVDASMAESPWGHTGRSRDQPNHMDIDDFARTPERGSAGQQWDDSKITFDNTRQFLGLINSIAKLTPGVEMEIGRASNYGYGTSKQVVLKYLHVFCWHFYKLRFSVIHIKYVRNIKRMLSTRYGKNGAVASICSRRRWAGFGLMMSGHSPRPAQRVPLFTCRY